MSYYEDVYLKRLNRDGNTQQERIKAREEREFDRLILQKTKYKSFITAVNNDVVNIQCSLQPGKNDEVREQFKLMTSNSAAPLNSGDILNIYQKVDDDEKEEFWLILHVEDDITKGYRVYRVLCLEHRLNITDEHGTTTHSIPVKFVNTTQNWVLDMFQKSKTSYGYREPNGTRSFITADFDFLTKDLYFNYKDRGFKIQGKDNISIDGVAYVSIDEVNVIPEEPVSSDNIPVGEDDNFFLMNKGDRYGNQ